MECSRRCSQNVIDWDRQTIVGTSTKLEKPFLRLTSVRLLPAQFVKEEEEADIFERNRCPIPLRFDL